MSNEKAKKVKYDHLNFRLAAWEEERKIIDFVNDNFDMNLPLVNNRALFEYYYYGKRLQFALAEQDGALVAVAGYILANESDTPDLWVSVWVALKGAMGAGLELMDAIPRLTNARVVACNNIRENTCPFYRFLGWTAERLPHYYRLSKAASEGKGFIARPFGKDAVLSEGMQPFPRLPTSGDVKLTCVKDVETLEFLDMPVTDTPQTPAKDLAYIKHRYFENPYFSYLVWSIQQGSKLLAYCVTRDAKATLETPEGPQCALVTRLVDFIGEPNALPLVGKDLDRLIEDFGIEYMDCYCAGIDPAIFAAAGFSERTADDTVIIPNYLDPVLVANTDYFYFTNLPDGFTMFKADGDQDRPNLG